MLSTESMQKGQIMCALNFDPKQCGFSDEQWSALSTKKKEQFKAQWNAWSESQKEQFKEVMANKDASAGLSGDAIKTENQNKGTSVESSAPKTPAKTTASTTPLEDNEALQKQKLAQYEKEYAEQYKKNPDLANKDIADLVYTKEKFAIENKLKELKETPDGQVLLADRYLREFASEKETAQFAESYERYLKEFENDDKARDAFNGEFFVNDKEKYIRDGKTLSKEQRRMVAHRKALIETLNIDEGKIGDLATNIIKDRYVNGAMNKMAKFDDEISAAIKKKDYDKAEKIKQKAIEYLKEAKTDEIKTKDKDTKEAVKLMAEAKLEREIAEERVRNRQVFYSDKDPGYDKENPNHKVLTKKMKEFVDDNPETFKDKDGNFDGNKFKEFFVRVSNENETETDGYDRADYMTSIENRKRGNDEKTMLQREADLKKQYPELSDPAKREQFLEQNPKIADELSFINTKAKLKDRRFQGACADICGLDKEKDKLVLKRAGHVLTSALKGAAAGFASGALMEAFATTKIVNADYAGILQYAGTVGYQGYQKFQADYEHKGSVDYSADYEHKGTVGYEAGYEHKGTVGFEAGYEHKGTVGFEAGYEHHGSANYTHNGSVNWNASGSNPSQWTWEKWENGVLEDSGTISKDVPWSANGTKDYTATGSTDYIAKGTVTGSQDYVAKGTVTGSQDYVAKGTVTGSQDYVAKGTVNGTKDYTAKGTVEGEVEFKGEKDYQGQDEYSGTTSARHKFDWSIPLKAAAFGAATGAIGGLMTMNKVKYDGGGPRIEARKKVAERTRPNRLDLDPVKPQPVKIDIPKPDLDIKIKPIVIPERKPDEYYDYKIKHEEGKDALTHEIKYKENPKTIIEGRYGVHVGTKEYDEIQAAMFEASGYEKGTNLFAGDKFVLPTVEINGKEYKPNNDPSKVKTENLGGKARVAHLNYKVQSFGGGYYIVDNSDPQNPKRLTGLMSKQQAEAQLAKLQKAAEDAGKKPRN